MSRNGSGIYNLVTNSWNPATNNVSATAADWQSLINDVASALTQSVSADGQTPITGSLNMGGNRLTNLAAGIATGQSLRFEQLFDQGVEQDVASGATTDIGIQNSNFIRITGTTSITSFGTNYRGPRFVRFGGVLTLTHNATTLILPTSANITTAAGDRAIVVPIGNPASGWQVLAYQRADGSALNGVPTGAISSSGLTTGTNTIIGRVTAGTGTVESLTGAQAMAVVNGTRVDVASAATVDLSAVTVSSINITGTTTITAFTIATGRLVFVRFNASLTLTNNANIVTQIGANIITQAGDTCILRATAANVVEVLCYVSASKINNGTAVASTSGTAIDFTNIPPWAKRVTVLFNGVSTSGTSTVQVQVGTGSVTTTGYASSSAFVSTAPSWSSVTSGFHIVASTAGSLRYGAMVLQNINGNNWISTHTIGDLGGNVVNVGGGSIALGGTLDRVRITTVAGVDTFDAGTLNISWE